jgi:hypothetical protein
MWLLKETPNNFSAKTTTVEETQSRLEKLENAQEKMMEGINFQRGKGIRGTG